MDDLSEHKKAKGTKKAVVKRRLMFKNYRDCLFNNTAILRLQQRFKNDCHEMYTEEVNKIVLSSDDGKRLPTFDRVKIYKQADWCWKIYLYAKDPYGTKYQFLINKIECTGLKYFDDSRAFIEYPNNMWDVYKNINEYSMDKELKILIVFDDMIADMINKEKS